MNIRNRSRRAPQRGMALLVVLILLTVMVLGTLAFTRLSATGVLIAGNAADKDGALQASESGVNAAYVAVQALASDTVDTGSWYFAVPKAADADGLPSGVDWSAAASADLNGYSVRYVVERLCSIADVTDPVRQCVVKQANAMASAKAGAEAIDPPNGKLYRITVRSTGLKGTATFVQVLMTRSS